MQQKMGSCARFTTLKTSFLIFLINKIFFEVCILGVSGL